MNVAILMVTYGKDREWAGYAMRSAKKYATGFTDKVVVVPTQDVAAFEEIAHPNGYRVIGFDEHPGKGMLHHMIKILEADLICPGANAILHQDADCLFTEPVHADDYFEAGKPIMLRQRFDDLRDHGVRYLWRQAVTNATGLVPEWETMVRHPSVHLREVYGITRMLIGEHTRQAWTEYILSCRNEYPQTFAEFPTIGAVAEKFIPQRYAWKSGFKVNGQWTWEPQDIPPAKMLAFWSHGGLEMENDRHPGRKAREVVEEILA